MGICEMFKCNESMKVELDNTKSKLKIAQTDLDLLRKDYNNLMYDYNVAFYQLQDLQKPDVVDRSFVGVNWITLSEKDLVTNKYKYYGKTIPQDCKDLLDSTYTSRTYAKKILSTVTHTPLTPIKDILKYIYNYMIKDIKYVTNDKQYGLADQWDNGDLALISKEGDCDVTSRAFIRVCKDYLNLIEHKFDKRNFFLFVGFYKDGDKELGHAWVQVWIDKEWFLFELTKESTVSQLHRPTSIYIPYLCHNNRDAWGIHKNWKVFI